MPWDSHWDKIYSTQGYRAKYPNEELIRFIARFADRKGKEDIKVEDIKVLDLGCGSCNHTYWLAKEGFLMWGIDGSKTAIRLGKERLEASCLNADVRVGDMTKLPFEGEFFDLVIDVGSIQHNKFRDIMLIFQEVYRVLKPDGWFFLVLRSSKDYCFKRAMEHYKKKLVTRVESHTFAGFKEGDLADVGITHFFHIEEIKHLLRRFTSYNIETTNRTISNGEDSIAHFIVRVKK